ncbi:hypothetical protein BZL29_6451 [Mycobacterium kansasii]|uniref:Uncharacterized protein n=1 Tax=Mycobacterium kansasii TaxID=1768 RepID=A0A1V3WRM7_MYCKA|nr:hypothetical protein BZL29_6451 [Mycobacterium kansasii]
MNDRGGSSLTASIVAVVVPVSPGQTGDRAGRNDALGFR